jgi:POT family proton-dependent oligopeptide transporter
MSESKQVKRSPFPATFYVANVMEIFERMAWYGFFAVSSLYITSPPAEGGLGFSSAQRGVLQGVIPFLLYLFPVITGALADRYGYRKTFLVAFSIMVPSYYMLGQFKSFWLFFAAFLAVAIGAATFKPVVVGTVGRTTDATNQGLGFGIFYTIVNIGGFVGPIVAGYVRAISWDWVFIMSAIWIGVNFIPTLFFYKEPTAEADSAEKRSLGKTLLDAQQVLGNGRFALMVVPTLLFVMFAGGEWLESMMLGLGFPKVLFGYQLGDWGWAGILSGIWLVANLLWDVSVRNSTGSGWASQRLKIGNWPFVLYLVILSGFWASFNQIFITLPVYIRDFVETKDLVAVAANFGDGFVDFIAHVNVDRLAAELPKMVTKYGDVAVGAESHKIFLELVHFKVRVPEAVIAQEFTRLTASSASPEMFKALATTWAANYRQVNPEYIVNLDAGAIIIFQILVSYVIQRWKPFPVLVVGTIVAGTGIALGSVAVTGYLTIVAVVVFAFGEMIASPKSQEYVARIAPKDKVALFMGYYFVSIALGNLFGGILSGTGYQKIAKGMNNPELMWIIFGGIGFLTAIALLVFNKFVVPKLEAQRLR